MAKQMAEPSACTCDFFYHNPQDHDAKCPVAQSLTACGLDGCQICEVPSGKKYGERFGTGIMTNDIGPLP